MDTSLQNKDTDESGSRFTGWRLLGLSFWQAWQMITMLTGVVVPDTGHFSFAGNVILWLVLFITVGYLVVVLFSRRISPFLSHRFCFIVAGVLTALGTIIMPLTLTFLDGGAGFAIYLVGAIIAGMGNALLLIMWGELWSALATGRVGRHLYVSYTFAFVLFFVVYALPNWLAVLLTAAFPIISVCVLSNCRKEPRREPSVIPLDIKSVPVVRILTCIVIISIVFGMSQVLMNFFQTNDEYLIPKALILAGCAIGAIALSLALSSPDAEPVSLYRPIIPAMVAGLILIILLPSSYEFVGAGLIIMGVYCLDMLMMLVSTDVAFRGRIPVAFSFGLVILCARIGTLVGTVSADALMGAEFWSFNTLVIVFLLGVLVLVIIGMLFFTQTDVQLLHSVPRKQANDISLEEKCNDIAEMCHLTNREREVLILLARGRTVPYICEELSIARGTAKHHVGNIYRKIGVFDRQGLLDAIEQGGVGKPGWE